jgi:hypothetical protein
LKSCVPGPADRQSDGSLVETPDLIFELGIPMKKIAIAAALLMTSASAHAGTFSHEGVTLHVQDGCRSSSCVSVYAPRYGYYHGVHSAKLQKVHKDTSRFASAKKDDAAPATDATPAKTPEATAAPAAPSSDAAPAK